MRGLAPARKGLLLQYEKDGISKNNLACFKICTKFKIDRTCRVGKLLFGDGLQGLLLFSTRCGRSATLPLCERSDFKHVCKRFRMNAKNGASMNITEFATRAAELSHLLLIL